ncbi:unnamed protein product [Cyclocybe aegerita]|uniref:F-box domain-containing protein n=1 Tax=Cyclocybe aegerita TaxID=1973307 RepID=A0A8S0W6Z2_CYCAE|nr:unnamed protein product [Cyclocybe aegerita]
MAPNNCKPRIEHSSQATPDEVPGRATDRAPVVKKKKRKKRLRGVQGALSILCKEDNPVPDDMLFEICLHLSPIDLCNLSLSCEFFRDLLLNPRRHSGPVWCSVLSSVEGLPPCPEDITPFRYALMMLDHHCQFCFCRNAWQVFVIARVRCCINCAIKEFSRYEYLSGLGLPEHISLEVMEISPYREPISSDLGLPSALWDDAKFILDSHMEELQSKYNSLESDEERQSWLAAKALHLAALERNASIYEDFLQSRSDEREDRRNQRRLQREELLIQKLKEGGFTEKLTWLPVKILKSYVSSDTDPNPATARGWQKLLPKLTAFIERQTHEREMQQRRDVIAQRCRILKRLFLSGPGCNFNTIQPNVADIAVLPEIQKILCPFVDDTETEEGAIAQRLMLALISGVGGDFLTSWWSKTSKNLLDMVPLPIRGRIPTAHALMNATLFFLCKDCLTLPLAYPAVLIHTCRHPDYASAAYTVQDYSDDMKYAFCCLEAQPWAARCGRLMLDPSRSKHAAAILKILNLDARHITSDFLYCNNPVLVHQKRNGSRVMVHWNEAIFNCQKTTTKKALSVWQPATPQEIYALYQREFEELPVTWGIPKNASFSSCCQSWLCRHCNAIIPLQLPYQTQSDLLVQIRIHFAQFHQDINSTPILHQNFSLHRLAINSFTRPW